MEDLGEVLKLLGDPTLASGVLVGVDAGDDAAVVEVNGATVVFTVDYFTPLVDDARDWGRIAAANAMSDVYAMGGRPLFALNIAGWPSGELPLELLADVFRGGAEIAREAGMVIVGGHTIDDPEPKYGLCVIGTVDPDARFTIDAAKAGDVLVLSKPIGTGIVTTAVKNGTAGLDQLDAAVSSMTRLSRGASDVYRSAVVRACTDVTGFGLLGHLHRMCLASGVSASVDAAAVPLLPGARELCEAGEIPGGTRKNLKALAAHADFGDADETTKLLLCDAQTSGGLLGCVPADRVDDVVDGLSGELASAVVGRINDGEPGRIEVR